MQSKEIYDSLVSYFRVSPDQSYLAIGYDSGLVTIRNQNLTLLAKMRDHSSSIVGLVFINSNILVSTSSGGKIVRWKWLLDSTNLEQCRKEASTKYI